MTPSTDPNLVVALYRCSTDRQTDSGLGLEAQKEQVESFCKRNGLTIVASYSDLGVSGKAPLEERIGLVSALSALVSFRAGGLIVAKMDRLSRDPLLAMTLERIVEKSGCRILSASGEGTENDDPSQVLMRRILAAVAENESSVCAARIKAALQAKKARGERLGRPPFGFTIDGAGGIRPNKDIFIVMEVMKLRHTSEIDFEGKVRRRMKLWDIAEELDISYGKVSRILSYWKKNAVEGMTGWGTFKPYVMKAIKEHGEGMGII
jgi:DNA invertase Pin-like site-specific DNA recombinase